MICSASHQSPLRLLHAGIMEDAQSTSGPDAVQESITRTELESPFSESPKPPLAEVEESES